MVPLSLKDQALRLGPLQFLYSGGGELCGTNFPSDEPRLGLTAPRVRGTHISNPLMGQEVSVNLILSIDYARMSDPALPSE